MSFGSVDTPLRATWDLHSAAAVTSSAETLRVVERLVEAQLFYVTLEQTPLLHSDCKAVVDRLAAAGCQLLVVSRGSEDELSALSLLPTNVALLLEIDAFIDLDVVDFARLAAVCNRLRQAKVSFGLSLIPTPERLGVIGPLLEFCLQQQIQHFKLPNRRINDNFSAINCRELVGPADVDKFCRQAVGFPEFRQRLQLDVHDLFLWEVLFPDGGVARSEYGGCQAANSLAHIDADGIVHPCVSWPQPLGSLLDASFYSIWQSPARQAVCAEIAAVPDGCVGCRDYALCFGGCRGLSRLDQTFKGRDPMCAGVR